MEPRELQTILEALAVDHPRVEVVGQRPNLLATVTSSSFADLDDGLRQELVWGHLRERARSADHLADVEFIFTNAPGEIAD